MNNNADLYGVLGVSKNASDKEIKTAYRKLAKTWHPDKFGDKSDEEKKNAEDKFKEISEAYEVLSNKEKRQQYDMFGSVDGSTSGGTWSTTNDDFFKNFMGGSMFGGFGNPFHTRENIQEKGTDKKIRISVTIEDVFFEREKNITYDILKPCNKCSGSGSSDGQSTKCPHCGGSGFVTKTQHFAGGYSQQTIQCPYCHGKGYTIQNPCPRCNGTGLVTEKVTQLFKVPRIDELSLTYKISGEGNACHNNKGINGDLYFVFALKETPDDKFTIDRENYANIYTDIEVSVIDCLTGCTKIIETPSKKKLKVKIPQGTKDGHVFTFNGYGFKCSNGNTGKLLGRVKMTMPKLTNEQINKIKEIVNNK